MSFVVSSLGPLAVAELGEPVLDNSDDSGRISFQRLGDDELLSVGLSEPARRDRYNALLCGWFAD